MTAASLMRLLPETGRIVSGTVELSGVDLLGLPEAAMRTVRGRRIAMIFQEPATSLNPVLTIGTQIGEVLERHTELRGAKFEARILELLDAVGVPDAARRAEEYPFQLSGGLKQRAMIAMALAAGPDLLIADEPTTALDVTIQSQVLELLRDLQKRNGMAILLITHDLGIVAQTAHRVAVMYAGQIVEVADRDRFFAAPQHPYSRKLFAAIPGSSRRDAELSVIKGQVPPLTREFRQCRFAERCDFAFDRCLSEAPGWTRIAAGHEVRCFLRERERAGPVQSDGAGDAASPAESAESAPLLSVRDLKVHFPIRKGLLKRTVGHVKAVDGVSLDIRSGRTLGLVGESGCGKTTVGKAILQLVRPTSGEVRFGGVDLTRTRGAALRMHRRDFQIIFQDPYASLNPRMRVADILAEGMAALGVENDAADRERARARRASPAHHLRRTHQRARRFGTGADPQSAQVTAAGARAVVPLHHAQHRSGRIPRARSRGDVLGAHRRTRHRGRSAAGAEAPVYAGAARRGAEDRTRRHARGDPPGRRAAFAGESARGLPFPPALPEGDARMPRALPGEFRAVGHARRGVLVVQGVMSSRIAPVSGVKPLFSSA